MKISDNTEQDVYIQKLVANVNIGLFGKSINNSGKAFLFENLSDARHYEQEYGGNINFMRQFKQVITEELSNLDVDVVVDEEDVYVGKARYIFFNKTNNPLCILSFKAIAKLCNDFININYLFGNV